MSAIGFYQAHRKRSLALLDSCYVGGALKQVRYKTALPLPANGLTLSN